MGSKREVGRIHNRKDGDSRGIKLVFYAFGFEVGLHFYSSYKSELVRDCFIPVDAVSTSPPAPADTLHLWKGHHLPGLFVGSVPEPLNWHFPW